MSRTTDAPTVPKPAIPIFSGEAIAAWSSACVERRV
jgi:hypothetical protein